MSACAPAEATTASLGDDRPDRSRPLILVTMAALLLVCLAGAGIYRHQAHQLASDFERDLAAVARLKVQQITNWHAERLGNATNLSGDPIYVAAVERWLRDGDHRTAAQLRAYHQALVRAYGFQDVKLLDPDGRVRMSLETAPHAIHPEARGAIEQAWQSGQPAFVDIHRHHDHPDHPPHVGYVAPLIARDAGRVRRIGAALLEFDAGRFLYPLIQSWPTDSRTAETLLVRRDGDEVVFLNELRHRADTALKLRIPLHRVDVVAVQAALGHTGPVEGRDYRGVPVIGWVSPVPNTPWFIVAKVDRAEAQAPWRRMATLIGALLLALMATVLAAGATAGQIRHRRHYRRLYRLERERRQLEQSFRTTLLCIGDAVITTDTEGRVQLLNPVAEQLTGWTAAEARGRPLEDVFVILNEETRAMVENPVRRVMREGVVVGLANHTLLLAKDGSERPIADSGAPIRDEQGQLAGVVLVFRDQTEERAAQLALANSEAQFRLLAEHAHDMIYRIGLVPERRFEYISPSATVITGYSPQEFYADPDLSHKITHPEDLATLQEADLTIRPEGQALTLRLIHRDGRVIWTELHRVPVYDSERRLVAIEGIARDVTERMQAEAERERLQSQLLQAQKMESVGRLAGGVAHDFNNMLGVIIGHAELLAEELPAESELAEDLAEILAAARRSADLTRQLLAFARLQTVQPRALDLNDTVAGSLKMLRRLVGEDIELTWKPGEPLWPVFMDPVQIDQILANLLVNARDAIEGTGAVTISTANITLDETYCAEHVGFTPGDYVLLSVSDTGVGMSPEVLERIFDPFFTTKELGRGTGLGLSTVYGIVKQNNGCINVYSEPGRGTTFRIYLPRREAEEVAVVEEAERVALPVGAETILVVEDDDAILQLSRRVLERQGCHVLAAASPTEALSLSAEYDDEIHLVLADVIMPQMNGVELVERLRQTRPQLRAVYASGYPADVIAARGMLPAELRFLQKPFGAATLAHAVRDALDAD